MNEHRHLNDSKDKLYSDIHKTEYLSKEIGKNEKANVLLHSKM